MRGIASLRWYGEKRRKAVLCRHQLDEYRRAWSAEALATAIGEAGASGKPIEDTVSGNSLESAPSVEERTVWRRWLVDAPPAEVVLEAP
jgi:hypothetical protein